MQADVVVIGSGAGGAPVAKELAEAGARVVVLEEGTHHPPEEMSGRPREDFPRLYRDAGQTVILGTPPITLPLGQGVGGTTLVNSGTCFRTPPAVLERWREELGLDLGDMEPWFQRVEKEIGVAEIPRAVAGRNALIAERGARALGWSHGLLRRNARGCVGSGVCAFGCPVGAKQHTGVTYMASAAEAGATILTGTRATRIETDGDSHATRVLASTRGGGRLCIRAGTVVVAAGTIHTPGLLARSRLGMASGQLGRNLSIHPATAVWAVFDDELVDIARGVPQALYVDEFASEGIMLEGVAGPPDYVAMAMPFAGPRQRELMLNYRHLAQLGVMVSDRSRGRVSTRGRRPLIRYSLNRADLATFKRGIERLVELWWAAGASRVVLPIRTLPELPRAQMSPLRGLDLRPRDLKLMAFHPLGTARASRTPETGVVDQHLRVHGTANVYVSDGSVVPSALGVNPQVTIMALATRLAFHLQGRTANGRQAHVVSH